MDHRDAVMLSVKITTNLRVIEAITDRQRESLVYLMERSAWRNASITIDDFDLPKSWITVVLRRDDSDTPYMVGISPEGDCHS